MKTTLLVIFSLVFLASTEIVSAQTTSSTNSIGETLPVASPGIIRPVTIVNNQTLITQPTGSTQPTNNSTTIPVTTMVSTSGSTSDPKPIEESHLYKVEAEAGQSISVRKEGSVVTIQQGETRMESSLPMMIQENKVVVRNGQVVERVLMPLEVSKMVETLPSGGIPLPTTKIGKIEFDHCQPSDGPERMCQQDTNIYKVETITENKLLGVIPVRSQVRYQIGATSGKLLKETKPWYLNTFSFLFSL